MKCASNPIPGLSLHHPYMHPLNACLALFLTCYAYAQCCHGDGSGVRHVHINYHGHSLYYQAKFLRLVDKLMKNPFVVAMVMVVMGDMCVQSITAIHTFTRLLFCCWW